MTTEDGARPRLLVFLNSTVRAGVEEVALSLARGLPAHGFEVHLAAPQPLLEQFEPDLASSPEVRRLPIHLTSFRQRDQMRRLAAYLREQRIQIVNPHLFYATLFVAPLARWARVPVVIETTHGPEAWRRTWWKRRYWVDRLIERFVSCNVAVSQANRHYLEHAKRYPARKLHVIPNGCDLARFLPPPPEELEALRRQFNLAPEDRVVVCVARLEAQKGHAYLLDALPAVLEAVPRLRLILVGDGSLRPQLEEQARRLGAASSVIFAGYQNQPSLFYRLAEFAVLPSLYEGMPLTAIEAGASGRALVATAVDGTKEVVLDQQTGLLVPPADPPALARAMLALLTEPARAEHMGQAAGERIRRHFSLERQVLETATFYRDRLAEATRR